MQAETHRFERSREGWMWWTSLCIVFKAARLQLYNCFEHTLHTLCLATPLMVETSHKEHWVEHPWVKHPRKHWSAALCFSDFLRMGKMEGMANREKNVCATMFGWRTRLTNGSVDPSSKAYIYNIYIYIYIYLSETTGAILQYFLSWLSVPNCSFLEQWGWIGLSMRMCLSILETTWRNLYPNKAILSRFAW